MPVVKTEAMSASMRGASRRRPATSSIFPSDGSESGSMSAPPPQPETLPIVKRNGSSIVKVSAPSTVTVSGCGA